LEDEEKKRSLPKTDSAVDDETELTRESFEGVLRQVSHKIEPEPKKKKRELAHFIVISQMTQK